MYLEYFGLKEEPFSMTPNPRFIYWSRQHEKAVESLIYGIEQRKGFLLLTGEIGTGKTTLCREIINRLGDSADVSVILNPLVSVPGLLKAINGDFGNRVRHKSAEDQLENLNKYLLSTAESGKNAVVMIDEAQNLSFEALETVRLLSNLETDSRKLLQIMLVGQPELSATLGSYNLRQLNQRISIRQNLGTLEFKEWAAYVDYRLLVAGARGRIVFKKSVLKKIFAYTKGSPRLTNVLCDRILLAAFASKTDMITRKVVREAIEDLGGAQKRRWWGN